MSHLVTFTSVEGKKGYYQSEELDEALRFVERLRNNEGVNDAQVFRLEEVQLEVKQYYKVEVAGVPGAGATEGSVSPFPPAGEPQPVEFPLEPANDALVVVGSEGSEPVVPEGRPSFSIFTKP